jgi:O-antigen/teichoic acid export membrane protein
LAVNPLFCIFDFLPSSNLERSGRFKEMALIGTAAGLMATIVTIAAAVLGYNYMSVAYAGWASGLLSAVLMNIVGRRHVNFRMGLSAWKRVAAFGAQMLAVSGINAVSLRLADLALGRMLGLGVLGIYNRASGLNGLLWNVHLVTGRVLFVEFANLNRRGAPLGPRYLRTVEIATAALWPAFAGFAVLAGPFILTVFGARWLPATAPLALLAVASMILVSITMTWELFAATNELKAQTRIEFIRAIVGLVLFVVGCMISLNAAAGARILDAAFAVVLYRRHLERMLQLSFSDFFPAYGRSALLTLLAIAPATVVMGIYRMSAYAPLPLLLCSVVAGVLLWGMGLKLLKHPLVEEGRLLLRRIRALPAANPVFADSEISDEAALVNAAQLQQQFP